MSFHCRQTAPRHPVLRFDDVSLRFERNVALDGVSFAVARGRDPRDSRRRRQRQDRPAQDRARTWSSRIPAGSFFSARTSPACSEQRAFPTSAASVGVLFQEGGLFDSLTIEENVAYPLLNQTGRAHRSAGGGGFTQEFATPCASSNWSRRSKNFRASFPEACAAASASPAPWSPSRPWCSTIRPPPGLDPITANTIMALIVKERDMREHRQPHRHASLPGRAIDGQFPLQFRQVGGLNRSRRIPRPGEPLSLW